jgi:hypothetical protein
MYADVAEAIGATQVTVTDPHLLIHDAFNGSGADCQVTGTVTVSLTPGTVKLDSQTPGFGWSKIAGVSHSAYAPTNVVWSKETAAETTD